MARMDLDTSHIGALYKAIKMYPRKAEATINEVFHGEAAEWITESIKRLMPVSGRTWQGKAQAAKQAKSLVDREPKSNLSVTIGTKPRWHYLYFPDDGTNTVLHVGDQQFFYRGGDAVKSKIIDRCITNLTTNFEKGA